MPRQDPETKTFLFQLVVVTGDVLPFGAGRWIELVVESTPEAVRAPIGTTTAGLIAVTSSRVDLAAARSRIVMLGFDGLLGAQSRAAVAPAFGPADGVLVLEDADNRVDESIAEYLNGRSVVRAVAHRGATPSGRHELAIHCDWQSRDGALQAFKAIAALMIKRAAGRA